MTEEKVYPGGGVDLGRETYLAEAATRLVGRFEAAGYTVPPVAVTVGFTSKGQRGKRVAECWSADSSKLGMAQIFIDPRYDDGPRVLDLLLHEMVHAVVGVDAKHGPKFRACATAVGLTGKMRATVASATLKSDLEKLIEKLGEYPHRGLPDGGRSSAAPKQTTRMIKAKCASCGYTVRTTRTWLEVAIPTCPDPTCEEHGEAMDVEGGK
jgi:hypothetical protein